MQKLRYTTNYQPRSKRLLVESYTRIEALAMANGSNSGVTFAKIRAGTAKFTADNTTKSAEIRLLQDTLYKAGYWAGDQPTSCYDKYTVAAVKGFQKITGLMSSPTGDTDKATLSKLESWSGTLSTTRSTSPGILYIQHATQVAQKGDSGSAITTIKNLLKNKGYTCTATSAFDSGMYDNVVSFQRANGVPVDGVVGQGTLALLQNTATKTSWLQGSTVKLTAGLLGLLGVMTKSAQKYPLLYTVMTQWRLQERKY